MNRFTLIVLLLWPLCSWALTISGMVVGVVDGDTITVLDAEHSEHRIRLSGIDAPEKAQPFGQASKKSLAELVYRKAVIVDWNKRDRYQRILGKVLLSGKDINIEQIRRGMAWHYKKYSVEQPVADAMAYAEAEGRARYHHQGLWSEQNPVPPWEWRKLRH